MKKKQFKDIDLPEANGYWYTHYDCPYCSDVIETEGDTRGEIIKCDVCRKEFKGV